MLTREDDAKNQHSNETACALADVRHARHRVAVAAVKESSHLGSAYQSKSSPNRVWEPDAPRCRAVPYRFRLPTANCTEACRQRLNHDASTHSHSLPKESAEQAEARSRVVDDQLTPRTSQPRASRSSHPTWIHPASDTDVQSTIGGPQLTPVVPPRPTQLRATRGAITGAVDLSAAPGFPSLSG